MKRWMLVTLLGIVAVPAVILALLATEAGSSWLLGVASRAAGERFSYQSVEGDFLSELRITGLKVSAADQRAEIAELHFRWRPVALLTGRLHVARFAVSSVDYVAPEADAETAAEKSRPGAVSIPIAIQVDDVLIQDVLIRRGGGQNRIDRVVMRGLGIDGNIVALARLEVAADALTLTAHGNVDPSPPHAVTAGIAWSLRLPDGATAEGVGNVTGTLESMRVEHSVKHPFTVDVSGTVSPLSDPLLLDLSGEWASLRWPLEGAAQFLSDSGSFSVRGNLADMALTLDASLAGDSIPARSLRVDADLKRPGETLEAALRWSAVLVNGKEASGSGTVSGDSRLVRINHALEKPLKFSTRGEINLAAKAPELSVNGEWQELAWPLTGKPTIVSDSGRYQVSGVLDAIKFQLDADLRSEAAQIEQMDVSLEGTASGTAPYPFDANLSFSARLPEGVAGKGRAKIQGDAKNIQFESSLEQPLGLKAGGTIALKPGDPEMDISGIWQELRWPLTGEATFRSASGNFSVSGPLRQLALKVEAKSSGEKLPPADSRLEARVRPDGARIQALSIYTLGGAIRATGDVSWQPAPRWDLRLKASGLKPEEYLSEWPGVISIESGVRGRVEAGTPKIDIDALKLEGQLRGYAVKGAGAISIDGTTVSARNLRLSSGDNRIEVNGQAGERLDLSLLIDAPALKAVAPDLDGSLKGEGRLEGNRSQPRVMAKLSGRKLAWRSRSIDKLELEVDAGTRPGYRSRIVIDADDIRDNGTRIGRASISGDGTPEQHRLALDAMVLDDTVSAQLSGRYEAGEWSGNVESSIKTKRFGEWRTPKPAALSASRERARLETLCLVQAPGRVCAAGSWQAEGDAVQANGEIVSLPLALARPFMPEGSSIDGNLNGEFKAAGALNALQAEARVGAQTGAIVYDPGAGFESAQFVYRDARIEVSYAPSGARVQMGLELENAGSMRGSLETGALGTERPAPLNGRVEASFSDLGWLGVMIPQVVQVRGGLNAAVDIAGTTANPKVSGEIALKDGAANVPDLGLELQRINLAMRGDEAARIMVEGGVQSGGGLLEVSGRSTLSKEGERRVDVQLKGTEFEVAKLPTVHAYVSPDLRLSADASLAELTGSVHIPRAKVKLKELPVTAVKVSEDEVIVNAEQKTQSQKERLGPLVRMKVDVSLGEEVSFDGFGLTTRIDGNLAVSGETGKPPKAQGTLSLQEGRYQAYGQDLKIRTGRLLFAGPVDNPGIDLTAVRELKDVTAGIVVGGTVKSLDSRVFSEPSLPEAEAFSYLLTGRPLSGGSQTDAAQLQQAAAALGLKRANVITQQIQNMVGLDELTVGGDGVDQTSLLLGKQIAPDIFVRYALGLFEQSGKLILDYRLTDSVSVQAESGEQQGMDIIYKIEREKLF